MKFTYKRSGVDIKKGSRFVDTIRPLLRTTYSRDVLGDVGAFGAFFKIDTSKYKQPVLVSSTDGVGTKLKVAFMLNRHDTVGIDVVAMCVNDILTSGAKPIFFLDYLATGKLSIHQSVDIVKGIATGCRIAGCSLIGGETAEMPGFYSKGEYDISGFAVGIVEKKDIIDGSRTREGDLIIGLSSNGLHSNGYSLVRKLFFEIKGYGPRRRLKELECTIGEELLKPTRIYVKSVLRVIRSHRIKGIAHITGGGITENLPRILPEGLQACIRKDTWPVHGIFKIIQRMGNISKAEMFRTFNMGVGLILVVDKKDATGVTRALNRLGERAFLIGEVERGKGGVRYV
jgi:phosphoribosylformylglycinamidine cyclo-ligase